ncbi:hypothetical protein HMPREF3226_01344 [Prevotella corporis]|uniref:Uncharacterized protein n=1 Tax=Prevotella corporis TaxID=28128 RepID=A0A133Q9D9_9BACT|nr:hypothetical protein HMPREF3226_01344 [Prevotella corporis]
MSFYSLSSVAYPVLFPFSTASNKITNVNTLAINFEHLFYVLPCKYKVLSSNEQIFINNNFISLSLIFVRHKQPFGYISATLGLILANLAIVTASHDYDIAKMS